MKIGVLEWNVSALGGRQRTMLTFADFFVASGLDVRVYSNFTETRPGFDQVTFLSWFSFEFLSSNHFHWMDLKRRYTADDVPEEWRDLDVLLVPYGGYGHLQRLLPKVRVITWVINPAQARSLDVTEVWTNSQTSVDRLRRSERWKTACPKVVIPPHDYEQFRMAARTWFERTWDVMAVGSLLHSKGLVEFSHMVQRLGLRGIIVGACWEASREENEAVGLALKQGPCTVYVNLPRAEVARLMGYTRCLVSFSREESASLVLYEALNAGCRIVTLDVGASAEQIGTAGMVVSTDQAVEEAVQKYHSIPPVGGLERGLLFDRRAVGGQVLEALR